MKIRALTPAFSVCKLRDAAALPQLTPYCFLGVTDEEISLVCETARVPERTLTREDGWRAFRIEGTLDFSLVGVLAELSALLAARKLGIFAVSTYNTDYILTKETQFAQALDALRDAGNEVEEA